MDTLDLARVMYVAQVIHCLLVLAQNPVFTVSRMLLAYICSRPTFMYSINSVLCLLVVVCGAHGAQSIRGDRFVRE